MNDSQPLMQSYPVRELAEELVRANAPDEYHQATRRVLRFVDDLNTELIEAGGKKLACRAGCSLCCSLRVDVLAHEILYLAHHLRLHCSPAEAVELMERLAVHEALVLPLKPEEHQTRNIVCPLLRNGCCSVYAVRPQSCRRHHSLDLAACEYTYENSSDLDFPAAHDPELFAALSEAMQYGIEVYRQLGFDNTTYELGTALAEALEDPACWERWRNGQQTFLRASITPIE